MLRNIAFLPVLLLCGIFGLQAQDLTVVDFQSTMNPMTVEMQRRDFNDEICALVKVQLPVSGVAFEGNIIGDTPFKTNEYWVYLTSGTKFLQVKCPGHYPLQIDFRNLGIEGLVGKHIYTLRLKAANVAMGPQQSDPGANYLVLDITPKTGLSVRVDGQTQPVEDGMVRVYLKYGNHTYRVEADGYAPAEGQVAISSAGKTTKQIHLESVMAMLLVKPETPESSIFINDAMKGTGTWSGQLNPGLYRVEAKKEGYRSRIENVELFQRDNKTVTIPALTPIYGLVNVDYKPIGASVSIDGRELGTTPDMFNNVLIGQHVVTISKPGYQTHTETVTVREGEETRISGTLTAETRQQPAKTTAQVAASSQPVSSNGSASISTESNGDLKITVDGITFPMILVEGGTFTMGSSDHSSSHKPHTVTLDDFYMFRSEMTQFMWQKFMGSNPSSNNKGGGYPVENVSFGEIQEFLRKLNAASGLDFRLPTEAEWEYAARGGRKSRNYRYSGSNNLDEVAWYGGNSGNNSHEVRSKKPNELGLYDMSGNLEEICADYYDDDYYQKSPQYNPLNTVKDSDNRHVNRGGRFSQDETLIVFHEPTRRFYEDLSTGSWSTGFRIVLPRKGGGQAATATRLDYVQVGNNAGSATRTFTANGYSFEMIPVEGGTFTMGWSNTDVHRFHQVTLSDYMLGKFEVTEGLWNAVMGSPTSNKGDNYPAGNVSYNKAVQFCQRLSRLTGHDFRLPTEAEWEYAARGGRLSQGYTYPGTNSLAEIGLKKDNKPSGLKPVGQQKANELGIYDMAGNAYEWCSDWYSDKYYGSSPSVNPQGPSKGKERVKRGGYYNSSDVFYECGRRFNSEPAQAYFFNGFRIALSGNGGGTPSGGQQSAYQAPVQQSYTQASGSDMTFNANGVSFQIVPVAGGTFMMGSSDHSSSHKPHSVTLGSYGIGKYEVTQALWQAVMGNNPSYEKGANLPVVGVKYAECVEFCSKLSGLTGRKFRLPTEAEWEFAARGGNKSQNFTYAGSNSLDAVAWHEKNSGKIPHPVGQKKPNELGIYDMSGNAQEWCHDWYDKSYYAQSPSYNPKGPSGPDNDQGRVVRGAHNSDDIEVFFKPVRRYREKPADGSMDTGFRVAMDM